jgi:hypothetical protein
LTGNARSVKYAASVDETESKKLFNNLLEVISVGVVG